MLLKVVPGNEGGLAVGQRKLMTVYATGPSSYLSANGDTITAPSGMYIDSILGSPVSVSKTYYVRFQPSAVGSTRATWKARWYVAATNAEANSVDLSGESVQFTILGGDF